MRRPTPLAQRRKRRPIPVPEALAQGRGARQWHVRESTPFEVPNTQILEGQMVIPLNDSPCEICKKPSHSPATRAHEMIHATISPERVPQEPILGAEPHNIIIAEEFRVNSMIPRLNNNPHPASAPNFNCSIRNRQLLEMVLATKDYDKLIDYHMATVLGPYRAIPTILTKVVEDFYQAHNLNPDNPEIKKLPPPLQGYAEQLKYLNTFLSNLANSANDLLTNSAPPDRFAPAPWSTTIAIALLIQEAKKQVAKPLTPSESELDPTTSMRQSDAVEQIRKAKDQLKKWIPEIQNALENEHEPTGEPFKFDMQDFHSDEPITWAPMRIEEPPRPLKLPEWRSGFARRRAYQEGTIPKFMHRWPIDQAIFTSTRREPGGSVLVDQSGSMNLTTAQVVEIMEAAPASIIAAYAARDKHEGVLRILAKQAKRVINSQINLHQNQNYVDLPALNWLSKQKYPRIWVSDGLVVATSNHGYNIQVVQQVAEFCIKHRITRVDTASKAADILAGRSPAAR